MTGPPVRYTDSSGLSIAHRYAGTGSSDFVVVLPTLGTIEMLWDPPASRISEGIGEFARTIGFDRRGIGLSSPTRDPATLEEQLDDLDAPAPVAGRCLSPRPSRTSSSARGSSSRTPAPTS